MKARFPRIGPLLLRVVSEPQSSTAWAKGAAGERLVGNRLDALVDDGVLTLHDRQRPGSRANSDHIAIAPTGIYVVDAKHYAGRIERRDLGGWFRSDERLYIAGRDRTSMTDPVLKQTAAVRAVLGEAHREVPIWSVLCFMSPEVGMFVRPFTVKGASITWPRALQKEVRAPGRFSPEAIRQMAELLNERLRPA